MDKITEAVTSKIKNMTRFLVTTMIVLLLTNCSDKKDSPKAVPTPTKAENSIDQSKEELAKQDNEGSVDAAKENKDKTSKKETKAPVNQGIGFSRSSIAQIIRIKSTLTDQEVEALLDTISKQFDVNPGERIPIQGVLYASGWNGAFFVDNDEWLMDATILDTATNKLVDIPGLFLVNFYNGGIKIQFNFKWMFTFIPVGTQIVELDNALYGRGLGISIENLLGVEASWLPGRNRAGHIFHMALSVGAGGGIVFPKMEFHLRDLQ